LGGGDPPGWGSTLEKSFGLMLAAFWSLRGWVVRIGLEPEAGAVVVGFTVVGPFGSRFFRQSHGLSNTRGIGYQVSRRIGIFWSSNLKSL
jgi:hypothetical protein